MPGPGQSDDNKANVCNPNNPKGGPGHDAAFGGKNQADRDNHGNQLNPNYQPKK